MTFDLTPTAAQHDLARRARELAESVIRPVALEYDQRQEFPWPVLEEAARRGFYSPLFYRDLIGDPTGISLAMFMEELFWGCAGIGLAIVMPALALSAIGQAASPEHEGWTMRNPKAAPQGRRRPPARRRRGYRGAIAQPPTRAVADHQAAASTHSEKETHE